MEHFSTKLSQQEEIQQKFFNCSTEEEKYLKIIELGQNLPSFNPLACIEENIVSGCQSLMYLETIYKNDKLYFNATSEALISKGLAALLIMFYSGKTPQLILQTPPTFLKELGILSLLSPTRSNGIANLYVKMQKATLPYLI